jgi:hypothetical protein
MVHIHAACAVGGWAEPHDGQADWSSAWHSAWCDVVPAPPPRLALPRRDDARACRATREGNGIRRCGRRHSTTGRVARPAAAHRRVRAGRTGAQKGGERAWRSVSLRRLAADLHGRALTAQDSQTRIRAMAAGTDWMKMIRRLTVAPPYRPATITQARKKVRIGRPDTTP